MRSLTAVGLAVACQRVAPWLPFMVSVRARVLGR
jgi:hypothetical protein